MFILLKLECHFELLDPCGAREIRHLFSLTCGGGGCLDLSLIILGLCSVVFGLVPQGEHAPHVIVALRLLGPLEQHGPFVVGGPIVLAPPC
jgi:hypothetical protein